MQLDLSIDDVAWDNIEAVVLEVATKAAPRPVSVPVAKRRSVRSAQRSPSGGAYLGKELRWHLPARHLAAGVEPKPADVIEDGDQVRWTILTVEKNRAGNTYACGCVNLSIVYDLRDRVTIERAEVGYSAAGAATKVFPPQGGRALYSLSARVQEIAEETADTRGVRYGERRYEVTVDRQVRDIDVAEDRVKWEDGATTRYLDIVAVRQPERIDELPVLECEERR